MVSQVPILWKQTATTLHAVWLRAGVWHSAHAPRGEDVHTVDVEAVQLLEDAFNP